MGDSADLFEKSDDEYSFTDENASPLKRLESYIDYCFDTYDIVYKSLDRDRVQACTADWGRRRGQCKYNAQMKIQEFGKRVPSKYREYQTGRYAIFIAEALVGVSPEDDNGKGWKTTVRHELGHAIDHQRRGQSDHSKKFKQVMTLFGEERNNGQSSGGLPPRRHR